MHNDTEELIKDYQRPKRMLITVPPFPAKQRKCKLNKSISEFFLNIVTVKQKLSFTFNVNFLVIMRDFCKFIIFLNGPYVFRVLFGSQEI